VACGNNNVSRSYLSSQPSGHGARNGIAKRLAAGAPRTAEAAQGKKTRGYRSVRLSPQQIKAAAEKRFAEAQVGTRSGTYARAPQQEDEGAPQDEGDRYYSKLDSEGQTHQFLNVDSDLTFGQAHVHVIHDDRNDEVRLHVSFGDKNRHSEKIALVGASANEVDAAVDLLAAALKARMR
jgi:hypothetical protein